MCVRPAASAGDYLSMLTTRMILLTLLPPSVAGVALGAMSQSAFSSVAAAWTAAVGAVSHACEPPDALRQANLEDLANVRIEGRECELLAHVALPESLQETGPLPVLLLIHEFFGLNPSIVAKAQLFANGVPIQAQDSMDAHVALIGARATPRLSELNCLVIAPDTFRGVSTTFIPQAIWLALSTPQDRVNRECACHNADASTRVARPRRARWAWAAAQCVRELSLRRVAVCSLDDVLAWAGSTECSRVAGIRADTKRVALCGFCYGGGKALRYTTQARPDAATVVWYAANASYVSFLTRNLIVGSA